MTYKELLNNKFVQLLLEENIKYIKGPLHTSVALDKLHTRERMSKKERYVVDTFQVLSEMLHRVESLDYYIAFINSYPKTKLWEKTFGKVDFIRYHTEIYLSNIIGIFDRALLLVNQVYNLGISDKEVGLNVIITHKHLEGLPVLKALKLFGEATSNIRTSRNFSIHRGTYSDEELDVIGRYELISRSGSKLTKKQKRLIEIWLKLKFGAYKRDRKKEVSENNKKINKLCNIFLLTLLDEYKAKTKLL